MDGIAGGMAQRLGHAGIDRAFAHNRGKGRVHSQPHHHLAPSRIRFYRLHNRKGIEKLIGGDEQRPVFG